MFNVYNKKKRRGAAKTVFFNPGFRLSFGDSAISACQILLSLELFSFLRKKKFVAGLVVMGFCSTFALAFRRFGVRFSI